MKLMISKIKSKRQKNEKLLMIISDQIGDLLYIIRGIIGFCIVIVWVYCLRLMISANIFQK